MATLNQLLSLRLASITFLLLVSRQLGSAFGRDLSARLLRQVCAAPAAVCANGPGIHWLCRLLAGLQSHRG